MTIPIPIISSLAVVFYVGAITLHVLTIVKVVPHQWINGGRSPSYEDQAKQSKTSIIVLIVGLLFVLAGILFPAFRTTLVHVIVVSMFTLMWSFGTVMQLLGTPFERYGVVWLNLIGAVSHVLLVLLYFN